MLSPAAEDLSAALRELSRLGYCFESGGASFLDYEDAGIVARAVSRGACVTAIHPEDGQIDMMTSIAGFSYAELEDDATPFRIGGVEVHVGRLEKLLQSKRHSGRPKDLEFLRAFEARASEEHGE